MDSQDKLKDALGAPMPVGVTPKPTSGKAESQTTPVAQQTTTQTAEKKTGTVLKQGATYNPTDIKGNPNPTATMGGQEKSGPNIKVIIIGVALVLIAALVGIGMMTISSRKKKAEQEAEQQRIIAEQQALLEQQAAAQPVIVFTYTDEEKRQLRACGYTGTEIEAFQSISTPAQELIDKAIAEQEKWAAQFVQPYFDTASNEYKENLYNTWLGLPERDDIPSFERYGFEHTITTNLDYVKVPIYGNQVFLKVYLDDRNHDDWFFLPIAPDRWLELGDLGNIVVTYNYIHPIIVDENGFESEDTSRMFIVSATEKVLE